MLIPSKITDEGENNLVNELGQLNVPILSKSDNIVFAKWDEKTKIPFSKGINIQRYYLDKISPADIRKLPENNYL